MRTTILLLTAFVTADEERRCSLQPISVANAIQLQRNEASMNASISVRQELELGELDLHSTCSLQARAVLVDDLSCHSRLQKMGAPSLSLMPNLFTTLSYQRS